MHYHLTNTLRFMCCMSHLQTHLIFAFSVSVRNAIVSSFSKVRYNTYVTSSDSLNNHPVPSITMFFHFLNNSEFSTSFYLCHHSLMLAHYHLLPEPLLAFLYSYCMAVRRNHLCIPAMHTSVQRHQVLTRYKFPITSSFIQDLVFSSFSHTQTTAVQKY